MTMSANLAAELAAELTRLETRAQRFTKAFAEAEAGRLGALIALLAGLAALGLAVFVTLQPPAPLPEFLPTQSNARAAVEAHTEFLAPHIAAVSAGAGWRSLAAGAVGAFALAWGLAGMAAQRAIADLKASQGKDLHTAVADLAHRLDLAGDQTLKERLSAQLSRLQDQLQLPRRAG